MIPPGLPPGLAGVAEHMRADALALFIERGENDPSAKWLWKLANRISPAPLTPKGLQEDIATVFIPRQREPTWAEEFTL